MKTNRKTQNRALGQLMSVVGIFLFFGLVLILHVWMPIQSQRAFKQLKVWEKEVFQKKSKFQALNRTYLQKTSLAELDQWAKSNGHWRIPLGSDIVMLYEKE